jgi:hypothetical protein
MNKDLLLDGGPHKLTVADIRNILQGIQSDLSRLEEITEDHGVFDETLDSLFRQIRADLQKLAQFDDDGLIPEKDFPDLRYLEGEKR